MEAASIAHAPGHGHDDHHHGPPEANHSSRVETQLLGMMLFIISEIMVFGAFFTAYFFIRVVQGADWPADGTELPKLIAGVNTLILVSSSLTMHWALEGAKHNIKANAIAPVAKTRMTEELLGPVADKLGPEFVTPLVTYLVHEDVPVSGEVYSVGGGRVARVFIGVTPGIVDHNLSPESVRDSFDQIRAEEGYEVPANLNEEMGLALKALS